MPGDGAHPPFQVGEQEEELVPALPRHHVRLPGASAEALGELLQELITRVVSERVVHELEVVEVEVEHADTEVVPVRTGDRRLEHLLEEGSVRETGELVVVREERHLLFRALAFGDVEDHSLDQPGFAGFVVDRVGLLEHPVDRSVLVDHPVLMDEGLVRVVRVPVLVPRAVDVIGMDVVPPRVRVGQPFVLTDAEQLDDLRAHVDRFRVLIHRVQVDDGGDVLHQRPVLRLGLEARGPAGLQLRAVPKGEDQQRRGGLDPADVHLHREFVPVPARACRFERRARRVHREIGREQAVRLTPEELAPVEAREPLARGVRVDDLAPRFGHHERLRGGLQEGPRREHVGEPPEGSFEEGRGRDRVHAGVIG